MSTAHWIETPWKDSSRTYELTHSVHFAQSRSFERKTEWHMPSLVKSQCFLPMMSGWKLISQRGALAPETNILACLRQRLATRFLSAGLPLSTLSHSDK